MSGRSANVRVEQKKRAEAEKKSASTPQQQVDNAEPESSSEPRPSSERYSVPATPSERCSFPATPSDPKMALEALNQDNRQERERMMNRLYAHNLSNPIPKSPFRQLYEHHTEKLQNALKKKSAKGKEKELVSRPTTTSSYRSDTLNEAPTAHTSTTLETQPIVLPGSSTSSLSRAAVIESRPASEAPAEPLPPQPRASKIQLVRFMGPKANNVEAFNEKEADTDLWVVGGDVFVYLSAETKSSPEAMPAFRLNSTDLKRIDSLVLITLLNENQRNRSSIMGLSTVMLKTLDNPRASINLASLSEQQKANIDAVRYTIYIVPPPGCQGNDLIRWKRGTRNVLALLHSRPPIGYVDNVSEMLIGIHDRIIEWIQDNATACSMLIKYMMQYGLDDIRTRPELAVSMLVYSEHAHWLKGYRDGFVHCVGQYPGIQAHAEFAALRPVTKALMRRHRQTLDLTIGRCSGFLKDFDFDVMWQGERSTSTDGTPESPPIYAAFKSLQMFFLKYYAMVYGKWPPVEGDNWLTRPLVRALTKDFNSLYDFLVDRAIHWRSHHLFPDSHYLWTIGGDVNPLLSQPISMGDFFQNFDQGVMGLTSIPFPFPLLPESVPVQRKSLLFGRGEKKDKDKGNNKEKEVSTRHIQDQFRVAYDNATNLFKLGNQYTGNPLVEAFINHEQTELVGQVDPQIARLGRWLLIYGVIQVLGTLCLDTPNLMHYDDEIEYFLCPQLSGTPAWDGVQELVASQQKDIHSFMVPETWYANKQETNSTIYEGSEATRSEKSQSQTLTNGSLVHNTVPPQQLRYGCDTVPPQQREQRLLLLGPQQNVFQMQDSLYRKDASQAVEQWQQQIVQHPPPRQTQDVDDYRYRSLPPIPVEAEVVQQTEGHYRTYGQPPQHARHVQHKPSFLHQESNDPEGFATRDEAIAYANPGHALAGRGRVINRMMSREVLDIRPHQSRSRGNLAADISAFPPPPNYAPPPPPASPRRRRQDPRTPKQSRIRDWDADPSYR